MRTVVGLFWKEHVFKSLIIVSAVILAAVIAVRPLEVPPARPVAATDRFSVERALADLEMITAAPRYPGSPGYQAAREYLVAEFESMGLDPEVADTLSVNSGEGGANIGRARNIVVRIPGTDNTGAILLAGHLDTVHTTVGASDCGGCSAAVVETARALLAGSPLRNDVILLLEDGEETTRAGSLSFVEQHPWAEDVRVAINLEAMGTGGGSLLYVTGPENGWLIRESLRVMPSPVAYSFVNDLIWLTGTGGSDLDQFLMAADVGLGLVYLENVPAYHTMQDNVANLDPDTLQHQGATMLALARHFGDLPLDGTLKRQDLVYYNLIGHQVVRYPAWAGVSLALLAAAGTLALVVVGLRRDRLTGRGILIGVAGFLPLVLVATLISGGVWYLLRVLDPRLQVFLIGVTYDREWYTLAFVALSAGLMLAGYRLLPRRSAADLGVGALVWWVALAVLTSFRLPGSSYAFALPALFGLITLAAILFLEGRSGWVKRLIPALGAAGAVLIMAPMINFLGIFSGRAEVLMGLPLIAMLPAPFVALLAGLLLPVFEEITHGRRGLASAVLVGIGILILAGVALTARFTEDRPKPNMVAYVLDADTGEAHWVAGAAPVAGQRRSLLDEWTSQFFTQDVEETLYSPWGAWAENSVPAYRSPAPQLDLAAPSAEILEDTTDDSGHRHLRLRIASDRQAPTMIVRISTEGQIVGGAVAHRQLDGMSAETPRSALVFGIHAAADDGLEVTLTLQDSSPVTLLLEDHSYSLPDIDGIAIRPRLAWMMPSPTFISDATVVRRTVTIP